jgi:hypothetical protein
MIQLITYLAKGRKSDHKPDSRLGNQEPIPFPQETELPT